MRIWHANTTKEVLSELNTSTKGISDTEADLRLKKYGPNKLEKTRQKSPSCCWLLGMIIALQSLQLLWLNLLTDRLLGLDLATDPAEEDTARRPPGDPEQGVLEKKDVKGSFIHGSPPKEKRRNFKIYFIL